MTTINTGGPAFPCDAEWRDDQPAQTVTTNGRHYDLTALETPFGLLPEAVKNALMDWPHRFEYYTEYGWLELSSAPIWHNWRPYRAKPAPAEVRVSCQRGLAAFRSDMEFGTCIKRDDGSIDWATWRDAE